LIGNDPDRAGLDGFDRKNARLILRVSLTIILGVKSAVMGSTGIPEQPVELARRYNPGDW